MAKKKTTTRKTPVKSASQRADVADESLDESPEIRSAADALRAAQEELKKAHANYQHLREQAAQKVEELRDTTVGDMVDGALDVVRKYPGSTLLAAFACGFLIDRWIRK